MKTKPRTGARTKPAKASPIPAPRETPSFPMRINRYLALHKHSTRRGADELIKKSQVMINGRRAVLGDRVNATDIVEVKFRGKPTTYSYRAYNKPRGTRSHETNPEAALAPEAPASPRIKRELQLFPVSPLEKEAHGLVILTNDGRVTDRLLSSAYPHEKEYVVITHNPLRTSFKAKMEAGVKIENEQTGKCKVKILDENKFSIVLFDEKKHQVRRACSALFQEVADIECRRVMNIKLENLKEGATRVIEGEELKTFLETLQLS